MKSYPTVEDAIIHDNRISPWLAQQIVDTRDMDLNDIIKDVKKLQVILDKRVDRRVKERKTFKTQVDLNVIQFD